jgi:hypothetical protein
VLCGQFRARVVPTTKMRAACLNFKGAGYFVIKFSIELPNDERIATQRKSNRSYKSLYHKKILLPFDNRMLMTIHINMKNYDLTFFFSFISAFVPSPIIMFPKLDLISILIVPEPDLPS